MAGEATTIARPYAEAIFARAKETEGFQAWADTLEFLSGVVSDRVMKRVIRDPKLDQESLTGLLFDIGGERLNYEAQNLVRLLVENDRLSVVPEIAVIYEQLKAESERKIEAVVRSPFDLTDGQAAQVAAALKAKLGRDVTIQAKKDPTLIGGLHIRAGDLVIDGSISGKLQQLAHELGI